MLAQLQSKGRGFIQKHGPSLFKQWLWDREFASGKWDNLGTGRCQHPDVERYARGGSVLDLGCGPGRTGLDLTPGSFSTYLGVDISTVAVDTAKARAEGRPEIAYAQGDLLSYMPPQRFDVILLGDSIYYVPLPLLAQLVAHYQPFLTARGVFIVRICDPTGRYAAHLGVLREILTVIEDTHATNNAGIPVCTLIGHG